MAKGDLSQFDWRGVGKLDADMWRAYYNRQFFRLFRLLLLLTKKQLGYSWLATVRLAYHSARAALDHRRHQRSGARNKRILADLTMFYKIISERSTRPFDYAKAAELEIAWWQFDRSSQKDRAKIEQGIAAAAAVVHSVDAKKLKEYAHYRAEAMFTPVSRGGKRRFGAADWAAIEELTIKAWHALWKAVQR